MKEIEEANEEAAPPLFPEETRDATDTIKSMQFPSSAHCKQTLYPHLCPSRRQVMMLPLLAHHSSP